MPPSERVRWEAHHETGEASARRLDGAGELLVEDPRTFRWSLLDARPDLPVVVRLPAGATAADVRRVLGPVLGRLTEHDRLVGADDDVRRQLVEEDGVPAAAWTTEVPPDRSSAGVRGAKGRTLACAAAVAEELRRLDALQQAALQVEVVGGDGAAAPVRQASGLTVRRHGLATAPDALFVPRPHVVVAWLPEGGCSATEATAELGLAGGRIGPGKHLVVRATVVPEPGGRDVLGTSELLEAVDRVLGGAGHLAELRSVRAPGHACARDVVLVLMVLGPGDSS